MLMNGIIIVNKGKGCTSRDIVNDIGHIFNMRKVGHTGTLDPIATGVLVITLGKYTKLTEILTSSYKEYIAEFKFGILTDTLDITGQVLKESNKEIGIEELRDAIIKFKGEYEQEVPMYSSVKVDGKKLYQYARDKQEVRIPKRIVDIKELELLSYEEDIVKVRCLVSKGTYIRSLIRDIGVYLSTYATMTSLVRTKQGYFAIEDSYTIDDIRNNNYRLLTIQDFLDVKIVDCNDEQYKLVNNGVKLDIDCDKEFILFRYKGEDLALYRKVINIYRMYLKIN